MTDQDRTLNNNLQRLYGITLHRYNRLVAKQNGRCAVCDRTPKGRLYVDHDHVSLEIRALLCPSCNTALGLLREDPSLIRKLEKYAKAALKARGVAVSRTAIDRVFERVPNTQQTADLLAAFGSGVWAGTKDGRRCGNHDHCAEAGMSAPILRCLCAYCGLVLRVGDAPEPISHGICCVCEARLHAELDADDARRTA